MKRSGQLSYTLRVSGASFPRYHAYVEDLQNGGIQVNLHVDQKEASYHGSHAHSGEYEGTLVEREMQRIIQFANSLKLTTISNTTSTPIPKKTGFLSKFF